MAFRILQKKCDACGRVNLFRRPKERLLVMMLPHLPCHFCNPEALKDCCPSCRYPTTPLPASAVRTRTMRPPTGKVFRHTRDGLCYRCYVSERRFKHKQALQTPPAA